MIYVYVLVFVCEPGQGLPTSEAQISLHSLLSIFVVCCLDNNYEPRREKTGFLNMRKQRRRSASR